MNDHDYLLHYGVLGMKWGRRKNRSSVRKQLRKERRTHRKDQKAFRKRSQKTAYPKSEDAIAVKNLRKKPVDSLSNAELKKINQRLNLEREYRNLRQDELNRGKKGFEEVMKYAQTANKAITTIDATARNVERVNKAVNIARTTRKAIKPI